jgi:(+)-trans-carveol dehydrogenase
MGKPDGKVAFITGGARGQGRSHALTLAGEGASVILMDNLVVDVPFQSYPGASSGEFEQTQKMLSEQGARYLARQGDVRNPGDLGETVSAGISEFGGIDIVVCNAGVALELKPTAEVEPASRQLILDTNLTGVFNTIRSVLPHMVERKSGRIIATSSMAGRAGYANSAGYSPAKWGVIGLIKTVASEYGPIVTPSPAAAASRAR